MIHRIVALLLSLLCASAYAGEGLDLYFVRHAQTQANAQGVHTTQTSSTFSEAGLAQVGALTAALKSYRFDAILVSPTERTQQTIRPYLEQSGKSAETWQELTECCWQHDRDDPKYMAGTEQVWRAADMIRQRYGNSGKTILVVAHYHSGQVLLAKLLGVSRDDLPGLENARITHLKQDAGGKFSIVTINVEP